MAAGGRWGELLGALRQAHGAPELVPVDTCVGSICTQWGGEGYFFPKSSLYQASGSLQRVRSGRPRRSWESTQCSSSVPPAGLGGEGKGLAEAAAHIQSGRKT